MNKRGTSDKSRTFSKVEIEFRNLIKENMPEDMHTKTLKLLNDLANLYADVIRVV